MDEGILVISTQLAIMFGLVMFIGLYVLVAVGGLIFFASRLIRSSARKSLGVINYSRPMLTENKIRLNRINAMEV